MVLNAEGNIILHQLFESKEDRISHLRKVQNKNFAITRTFPFVKNSCFCNNFFFSFIETYVSFNNFKDLLNLHYKMKYQAKLKNFFSLNFQWLQYDIWQFQCYQRYLETESATWIWQKPKQRSQYFNWKSDQPWLNNHIGNNWLDAIFLSPGDSHIKGKDCLSCFIWVLKVSLRLILIQKGGLCPLRLLPLMTEFSVFMLWA